MQSPSLEIVPKFNVFPPKLYGKQLFHKITSYHMKYVFGS